MVIINPENSEKLKEELRNDNPSVTPKPKADTYPSKKNNLEDNTEPTPQEATTSTKPEKNGGIQAALYAGSLLILAGVGGLVWSGLNTMGLILLIFAMVAFYVGGILLRKSSSYKIVSQVFVGTGMAILPFIGILFWNITQIDPKIIWLVLSLIGIPIFIYATYMMNNKVFSFVAILGFVSLSCSLSAVMGLSLVWYFALVMGIGIILDLLRVFKLSKKLGIMQDAIYTAGIGLPIAAFVASLFAMGNITELEYTILLAVIAAQCGLNLWHSRNILWEFALRLACFMLAVLITHLIVPNTLGIGAGLIIGASGEFFCSIIAMLIGNNQSSERINIEIGYTAMAMVCYPISSLFIADFTTDPAWMGLFIALCIDVGVMIVARFIFKMREWYFAILPIGIMLPVALVNMLGLTFSDSKPILMASYIACMFILEGLGWLMKNERGDAMFVSGVVVFGVAAAITSSSIQVITAILGIALGSWGFFKKKRSFLEASIYAFALCIVTIIDKYLTNTSATLSAILIAHTIAGSLILSSLLWERKLRYRMLAGCILLLVWLGFLAIGGDNLSMILFMAESAAILVCGLVLKQRNLWITGTVALFLAVLWFTREISFLWPVLLGLGLIGAAVSVIAYNNKKAAKSPATKSKSKSNSPTTPDDNKKS